MYKARSAFASIPAHLKDCAKWPWIDAGLLSNSARLRYESLRKGIEVYCRSGQLSIAAKEAKTSPGNLHRVFARCVSSCADGQIAGWRALVPHIRLVKYERSLQSRNRAAKPGQFDLLLRTHPQIKACLDDEILRLREDKGKAYEAMKSLARLADFLRALCVNIGLTDADYPLNTESCARKALTRYVKKLIERNPKRGVLARYGKLAAQMLNLGTGVEPLWALQALQPFDRISIDAHRVDCLGVVEFDTPSGPLTALVERIWLVAVFDAYSRAALGYAICFDEEVSARTVEDALSMSLSSWKPRQLSSRVPAYSTNSGFPSGLFPLIMGTFGVLLTLDNALVHLSNQIAEKVRRRLGCTLSWGPCGAWYHNDTLERFFGSLTRLGFQRLPSSTGGCTSDPARREPELAAIQHKITIAEITDLADVLLARHNALGHSSLAGRSPLKVIDNFLASSNSLLFARPLPRPTGDVLELGHCLLTVTVRGNVEKGRRPYIQMTGACYTSRKLSDSFWLIGERLNIQYCESGDFRQVVAYLPSGEFLGELHVLGQWALTPHTKWVREQVLKEIKRAKIHETDPDPIDTYIQNINNRVIQDIAFKPLRISASATKRNRIAHELDHDKSVDLPLIASDSANQPLADIPAVNQVLPPLSLPGPVNLVIRRPKWKTNG